MEKMSFLDTVKSALGTVVGVSSPVTIGPTITSLLQANTTQTAQQNPMASGYLSIVSSLSQLGYNPFGPGVLSNLLNQPKLIQDQYDQYFWSTHTPNQNDLTPMTTPGNYLIDPFSSTSTAYNEGYGDLVFLPGISGQFTRAIASTNDQIAKTLGIDKLADALSGNGEGTEWAKYVPYLLMGGVVLGGGYLLYKGVGPGNTVKHLYKYEINRKGDKN